MHTISHMLKAHGKQVKVLPAENLPSVDHDVAVAIIFWEDMPTPQNSKSHLLEAAQRMREARKLMPPLGISVKEPVEAGREH
jgi:hypothetical protein